METSEVWLIRHAQAVGNEAGIHQGWGSYPLSTSGVRNAEAASAFWREVPVTAVVSSPVVRALETAQILFGTPTVEVGFAEAAVPGIEGLTYEEAHAKFPNHVQPNGWAVLDADPHPLLESPYAISTRVMRTLLRVASRSPLTAAVTHGALLAAALYSHGARGFATPPNLSAVQFMVKGGRSRVGQVVVFDAASGRYVPWLV